MIVYLPVGKRPQSRCQRCRFRVLLSFYRRTAVLLYQRDSQKTHNRENLSDFLGNSRHFLKLSPTELYESWESWDQNPKIIALAGSICCLNACFTIKTKSCFYCQLSLKVILSNNTPSLSRVTYFHIFPWDMPPRCHGRNFYADILLTVGYKQAWQCCQKFHFCIFSFLANLL